MIISQTWEVKKGNTGMLSVYSDDKEGSICACGHDHLPENILYAGFIADSPNILRALKKTINMLYSDETWFPENYPARSAVARKEKILEFEKIIGEYEKIS